MMLALLIIGWMACGALACLIIAKAYGELNLSQVVFAALTGPFDLLFCLLLYTDEIIIWQRNLRNEEE